MNKDRSGQKDRPGTQQEGKPRQGKQKGAQKDDQNRRRPLEAGDRSEELGRPAAVGQGEQRRELGRTEQGHEWEDEAEGSLRQREPRR